MSLVVKWSDVPLKVAIEIWPMVVSWDRHSRNPAMGLAKSALWNTTSLKVGPF